MTQDQDGADADSSWPSNYFNYFTEIEEHFQRARGTSLFLLSPLDWALIEGWRDADVPLEAVLRGIDDAFEKWRSRKSKIRAVNSLAYCAQAVMDAAQRISGAGAARARETGGALFEAEEVRRWLRRASDALRHGGQDAYVQIADSLDTLASGVEAHLGDLEDLERRLTALEDKMVAAARTAASDETLLAIRRDLDAELRPYRGKMSAAQIAMLERRYLDTRLLETANLPRLSLFYLR